jgi:hypothetical protein
MENRTLAEKADAERAKTMLLSIQLQLGVMFRIEEAKKK